MTVGDAVWEYAVAYARTKRARERALDAAKGKPYGYWSAADKDRTSEASVNYWVAKDRLHSVILDEYGEMAHNAVAAEEAAEQGHQAELFQ